MDTNKGYQQILEWEYIDTLTSLGSELSIAILLYIVNNLNQRPELNEKYNFEIISYGFMGYYEVIGVQFINGNTVHLDEEYMMDVEFHKILKQSNMIEFIDFSQSHCNEIKKIKEKIATDNLNRFR